MAVGSVRGQALPVAVVGPTHVVAQVGTWIESRLGWQVTDGTALPAVVRLAAVGATDDEAAAPADCPVVVLVGPDDDPWHVARAVRRADAAVPWPAGHDDLEEVVARLLGDGAAPGTPATRDERAPGGDDGLVVGGACGGVGTTTVAITLAAGRVWERHGSRALAITSGPTPVPDIRLVDRDVVAGHRGWAAGVAVPGVAGLRVVRSRAPAGRIHGPDSVAVVVDVGVVDPEQEVDVLVVRRDAAGLRAVAAAACHTVVVADHGPVPRARLVEACAGRRVVMAPWSVRVARAHALGRVPASLPGTYSAVVAAAG